MQTKKWYQSTIFWTAGLACIGAALEALSKMPLPDPVGKWVVAVLGFYACVRRLFPQVPIG